MTVGLESGVCVCVSLYMVNVVTHPGHCAKT